jgi:hypothetical protein
MPSDGIGWEPAPQSTAVGEDVVQGARPVPCVAPQERPGFLGQFR